MAILEAILTSEYQGQLIINRWHYVSSGDTGPVTASYGLLNAMGYIPPAGPAYAFAVDTIAKQVQNLVSSSLRFVSFMARDLYSVTDFVETAFHPSTVGLGAGEPSSPALAYGLLSSRVRTDVRRGSKRFAGVTESGIAAAGAITGGALSELTYLADLMSDVLEYSDAGASLSFAPSVLSFESYETPSGKIAYRKYPTAGEQLTHTAQNVTYTVMPYVRTQTSRQYGHGA